MRTGNAPGDHDEVRGAPFARCRATPRGVEIATSQARFVVEPGSLAIDGAAGGGQTTLPRGDIVDVTAEADPTAPVGKPAARVVVRLTDGQTIVPVAGVNWDDAKWLAMRLREELGIPPGRGEPGAAVAPLAPLNHPPPTAVHVAAPPAIRWGEVRRRRGGGVVAVRVRAMPWYQQAVRLVPSVVVFFGVPAGLAWFGSRLGWRVVMAYPRPTLALAGLLVGYVVWVAVVGATNVLRRARSRYVARIGPNGLRMTIVRPWRPRQREFVDRRRLADVRAEEPTQVSTSDAAAVSGERELHVYLDDGDRYEFLRYRPRREVEWVAYQLSQALAALPPVELLSRTERADDRVLAYARPTHAQGLVRVRQFADGSVTVTIPPVATEVLQRHLPVLVAAALVLLIGAHVLGIGGYLPRFAYPCGLFLVVPVVLGLAHALLQKYGRPTVISVDAQSVWVEDPYAWRRRQRRWPREAVRDVRIWDTAVKGGKRCSVLIDAGASEKVAVMSQRTETDRRRVVRALRGALGMKPLGDAEMHVE